MNPEDRLDEALKQIEIVRNAGALTPEEERWLNDAGRNLLAVQTIVQRHPSQFDDVAGETDE